MKHEKQILWLERLFQILFLVYTVIGFNSLTNGNILVSVIMWPTFLLGVVLLCVRLWNWKHYVHTPGIFLLVAMCAIAAVSILANWQYDPKRNIIYLFFWVVYFFLFFAHSDTEKTEDIQKQFRVMGHVVSVSSFVLAVMSITMLFTRYSEILTINGVEIIRGFTHGILYGAYLTPNGGAILGISTIFFSVYCIQYYKKAIYTIWAVVNITAQFAFLVFSDSRSGMVALALGSAAYVLFTLLYSQKMGKGFGRIALITVLVVITGAGVLVAPKITQRIYNQTVKPIEQHLEEQPVHPDEQAEEHTKPSSITIDRGYDLSGDISNRRFDVWKSGLEIFAAKPFLGTTFSGFLPYAKENLPDTYIVTNDYMQMTTLDNDFINLLVSNGIFSFLCFFAFIVVILFTAFRYLARKKEETAEKQLLIPVLFALCVGISSSSIFGSGILYMQSPYSVLFWAALGLLTVLTKNEKKVKKHE